LNLVQRRRAPVAVQLDLLLSKQRVYVGIVAVGIGAALDDEGFDPGRRVAEGGALGLDDVLELLVCICIEEGRALEAA
jgi:hypothetical protein